MNNGVSNQSHGFEKLTASFIICTYNRPDSLFRCLKSVSHLDFPNQDFEVVVVDDSDSSTEIDHKFSTGPEIRVIRPPKRRGLPHARNVGISHARGNVLCFLDDDVILHKDWLSNILADYSIRGIGGVGGRATFRSFEELDYRNSKVGTIGYDGHIHLNFNYSNRTYVQFLHGTNMSFRASVVRSVGGFNESLGQYPFGEDYEFGLRVHNHGWKLVYEPKACVIHGGSGGTQNGIASRKKRNTFRLDNVSPRPHAFWSVRNATYIRLAEVRMPIKCVSIIRCISGNFRMFFLRSLGDQVHPTGDTILIAYDVASGFINGAVDYISRPKWSAQVPSKLPMTFSQNGL